MGFRSRVVQPFAIIIFKACTALLLAYASILGFCQSSDTSDDCKARLVRFPCKTSYIRITGFSFTLRMFTWRRKQASIDERAPSSICVNNIKLSTQHFAHKNAILFRKYMQHQISSSAPAQLLADRNAPLYRVVTKVSHISANLSVNCIMRARKTHIKYQLENSALVVE